MRIKSLPMNRALHTVLLVLLLSAVGLTKSYAYWYHHDFSAVCPSGQTLYYLIIGTDSVELVNPAWGDYSGYTRPTGDIIIPSTVTRIIDEYINGQYVPVTYTYTVASIGYQAFYNCSGLTGDLTIPNSVASIDSYAFWGCSGFTGTLTIGESLTSIPFGTTFIHQFSHLIVAPGNPVYDSRNNCDAIIETSTNKLLIGCNNTTIIPNSITEIGDYAFEDCTGLTSIVIPNSVTSIGTQAFSGCTGLTSLTIPNSVTYLSYGAFKNCSGLTEVHYNVVNNISFPSTALPFQGCGGMLIIGEDVECIPARLFLAGNFTGSLTIPNSVTSIGYQAFYGCSGFTGSLTIGNSVTLIGDQAFAGCCGFDEIIMLNATPPILGGQAFCTSNPNFTIYVPYESLNAYKTSWSWSDYASYIKPMLNPTVVVIVGYGGSGGSGGSTNNDKWTFIALPLAEDIAPTAMLNLLSEDGGYDLYQFDQSAEGEEWRNYKVDSFNIVNGRGYLYARAVDVNLLIGGDFNEDETKEVSLDYEANKTFAGWNLVGNPFPVSAYIDRCYYVMNDDGSGIEPNAVSSATAIAPCTGLMVKAEAVGESVTFSKTAPEATSNQGVLQIAVTKNDTRGSVIEDKAIVSFNAGDALEKFRFGKENAQIYLPQGGKDYAIAYAEKQGEMPLNFKAAKNGTYTITVNHESMDLDYLHLIDNFTGNEVDLLVEPNYIFEAKTTDYASRFRLVFSANENGTNIDSETFAFFNGNEWVIDNDGKVTVQVMDAMGRIVFNKEGACTVSTMGMTSGVYVLRLINGENVKTQKITIK